MRDPAGAGEAVGVGFEDEGAEDGVTHGAEAAVGIGVEGAGGAVREGESLLEWAEAAGIGGGYAVGILEGFEDRCGGGLAADDGGVYAFAGEGIDEAGGVSGEEDAAARDVSVAAHAEGLAGDVERISGGEGADAEFLVGVVEEELAGNGFEVCRRGGGAWGDGADADVDVVAFGEEPAVASGEWGEVEDEVVGGVAGGELGGKGRVGDGSFKGEAVGVPLLRGGQEGFAMLVLTLPFEAAGLAVGSVGAD